MTFRIENENKKICLQLKLNCLMNNWRKSKKLNYNGGLNLKKETFNRNFIELDLLPFTRRL